MDHPWLNSTEALDNVLPSAQLMMDKVLDAAYFVHQKGFVEKECWDKVQGGVKGGAIQSTQSLPERYPCFPENQDLK